MATDIRSEGEEFSRYVGAQVQGEITKRGHTVAGVTRMLGMDRSTLTRYLKGQRAFPVDVLYAVAAAVGADPGRIIEDAYEWFLEDHPRADVAPVLEFVHALTPSGGVPVVDERFTQTNVAAANHKYDPEDQINGESD